MKLLRFVVVVALLFTAYHFLASTRNWSRVAQLPWPLVTPQSPTSPSAIPHDDTLPDSHDKTSSVPRVEQSPSSPTSTPTIFGTPAQAQPLLGAGTRGELPLRLPAPPVRPKPSSPRIAELQGKIQRAKILAAYRELGDIYTAQGAYAEASRIFREEAAQYRLKKLSDAAIIVDQKAARYDTKVQLFLERAPTSQEVKSLYAKAQLEPFVGAYLGAFIDRDDNLEETFMDENFQTHRTPEEFARAVGKPHGTLFMYMRYGNKFPREWILRLKAANVIPHIAWEPHNLNEVRDDAYLQNFAKACREVDWPIFIRFASEMNGKWTPYHGNPTLYRQKFRLVHSVLHRYAPRVATIWCVNNPPLDNAHAYYPGDDGCDWVGVNFYSVPFYENKRNRPAFDDSPLALLDPIYKRYAARKPIAICEYAASHRPALDNVARPEFAIQKMSILYGALPRLYPRVKLIDWFNMSSIRYPTPGKTLNDYTLLSEPSKLATYRRLTSSPYFLAGYQELGSPIPQLPRAITPNQVVRGFAKFSVWSNFQLNGTKVLCTLGNKVVYASARPGAHEINLDLSRGPFGRQTVTAYVYDARNRFVNSTFATINIQQ
jgi:hypothetical protein